MKGGNISSELEIFSFLISARMQLKIKKIGFFKEWDEIEGLKRKNGTARWDFPGISVLPDFCSD